MEIDTSIKTNNSKSSIMILSYIHFVKESKKTKVSVIDETYNFYLIGTTEQETRGGISSSVLSVFFTDNCYKLLKSLHLIG